ncbi:MAG: GvpL/GvpF family gas vesicle protein [Prochlorotrichaceae cyanobacterium]
MSYGFYLYGIFPAPGPQGLDLQGLDKQEVKTHTIADFVFLYSSAQQERYLASRKNLMGHAKVLEDAMSAGFRNHLPLPLNRLIFQTWAEVEAQIITPYQDHLKILFEHLVGKREVGLKIYWDEAAELERLLEHNEPLRQQRDRLEGRQLSMDEVIRIGQAIETALTNHQTQIIEVFQTHLTPLAIEVVENDLQTESMIYNSAYLIEWDQESAFSQVVEDLDSKFENRLRLRYNNFTAPYNFASLPS